jgi:hypothetical protein
MNNPTKSISSLEKWYRRQGYHVSLSESSGWVELCKGIYQAFPYSRVINPSIDELRDLFKRNLIIALRYSTPITSSLGHVSYHVVYDNNNYPLSSLPKKARHDVTRGLQYASYESIPISRLADEGWSLRKDTLIRQGRSRAESQTFWNNMCLSAQDLSEFEVWGAIHEGRLSAALLACTVDDTVHILYQQSISEDLKYGVNNALTYTFTQQIIHRPGIQRIFYGLQSLDAPPSVDKFKFRMNYSSLPVRQRVVFNPIITPFIKPYAHKILIALSNIFKGNMLITKGEGMIRFYLQGKCRLSEQEWPNILLEQKNLILAQAI